MIANKSFLVISRDMPALLKAGNDMAKKYNTADVFWLKSEDGSIQVKETNEFIERTYLAPIGKAKLMIICDIAKMTPQAQNKILKTVEDVPASTTFLLLSTSADAVLNTIKSRCVTRYLPNKSTPELFDEDIKNILQTAFDIDIDKLELNPRQKHDILNAVSEYNKRVRANCNDKNQKDIIIMEILKCARK